MIPSTTVRVGEEMIEPFEGDKVKFNRDKTTPYDTITSVRELGLAHGYEIELEEEPGEYIIFETRMDAGDAAREVWENMVHDDPSEFRAIVGRDSGFVGDGHSCWRRKRTGR